MFLLRNQIDRVKLSKSECFAIFNTYAQSISLKHCEHVQITNHVGYNFINEICIIFIMFLIPKAFIKICKFSVNKKTDRNSDGNNFKIYFKHVVLYHLRQTQSWKDIQVTSALLNTCTKSSPNPFFQNWFEG